jgi:hypothetical protein
MMAPALSIVLVIANARQLAKVLRCYRATGDPDRLEIVVVAIAGVAVACEAITSLGFRHVQIITLAGHDVARAEERAVHAASAPYVVFGQPHGYPMPGFVDAIVSAVSANSWTVVGPSMTNANPRSRLSCATMCIHYGVWSPTRPSGVAASVPGHYSAYLRSALLALGDDLYNYLDAGPSLQQALRDRGGSIFFETSAQIAVVNVSRFGAFLRDHFFQGASFARQRRQQWHPFRRALYAAGAPLIPAVRLVRITDDLRRNGRLREVVRDLPMLLAGLSVNAAGECLGYATSFPADKFRALMFDRLSYVRDDDRRNELDENTWPVATMDVETRS